MKTAVQEALPVNGTKEVGLAPTGDPALAMIERFAADKDFDVAKLQALMDMRERELKRIAEQEFNAAFAKMQPRIPTIDEKGKTDKGTYAPREDIVEAIRPVLAEFGFSLSFRTEWPAKDQICIVGILTHEGGHSRESRFLTAADQSGSKNAVQALGSAVEYGRRYTTTDLLNIATRKADDDGKKAAASPEPEGTVEWADAAGKRQVGYAQWVDLMDAFVLEGCTKKQLDEKWYAAPEAFRKHISTTDLKHVEGWKKKAGK